MRGTGIALVVGLLLAAVADGQETPPTAAQETPSAPATVVAPPAEIPAFPPGTRVEIDGEWKDGAVEIQKIVREEPDEKPEIKGFARAIFPDDHRIVIPPFIIDVQQGCDIRDADKKDKRYDLDEIEPSWRLKIEGELTGPRKFRATDIRVERAGGDAPLEIEAFVEEERTEPDGTRVLVLLGVPCRFTPRSIVEEGTFRKMRRELLDYEEARPERQLVLFERLTIGGEVQSDLEYRDDYDLDEHDNEDVLTEQLSLTLEGTFDFGLHGYAFAKMRSAKEYVVFDELRDLHLEEETKLEELNLFWRRPFDLPLSLVVGRQDFDEEREWIYDENLDAVRVFWRRDELQVEYSWSAYVTDAPRGFDERLNQIAFCKWFYGSEAYAGLYVVDIRDHSEADDSPFFLGARVVERDEDLRYWLDYAYLDGKLDTQSVEAHGLDLGGGYQWKLAPLKPYCYAGYAVGTGDRSPGGDTSRDFRQTGYHDNNDKTFGVASFSYYGELLRPELSNLQIYTAGVGMRPLRWLSLDLLYHRYFQYTESTTLRDSRLRQSPGGLDTDLGQEFDIVLGLDNLLGRIDIEVDFGYFVPGDAFTVNDHPALWLALQVELNF